MNKYFQTSIIKIAKRKCAIDCNNISLLVNSIELEKYEIVQLLINHLKIELNQLNTYRSYEFLREKTIVIKCTCLFPVIRHYKEHLFELILSESEVELKKDFDNEPYQKEYHEKNIPEPISKSKFCC